MKRIVELLLLYAMVLLVSGPAVAAPNTLTLTYEASRNGQLFANITETYRVQNGRYRIESITKGVGVYALLGERKLVSEGSVTAQGLKPMHFELHQGDNPKRTLIADFDWSANVLNMQVKGKPRTETLETGTQDLASLVYQFMFTQPKGELFKLPVTTGKKLKTYQYRVVGRQVPVTVPAGKYQTVHLQDGSSEADEDQKELWLGKEVYYLPVKLVMRDDKGAVIEQVLTSIDAK